MFSAEQNGGKLCDLVHFRRYFDLVWQGLLLCLIPSLVGCQHSGVSGEILECIHNTKSKTNVSASLSEHSEVRCLRDFLWKADSAQWENYNITQKDKDFMNSLMESLVQRGTKAASPVDGAGFFPKTGFRIRREYRRLSDAERHAYHNVIKTMKQNGQYDIFANIHHGTVVDVAHGGPNFFGWHRIFLSLAEEAMRRIDPTVAIPYWDSTLDYDMQDPTQSIIWSEEFFGNGIGPVMTGPFGGWMTPFGPLTRELGKESRPISKQDMALMLKGCKTTDISFPTAKLEENLDHIHGRPHRWVGGTMYDLQSVSHDPAFFLHHSFIDYLWEVFRKHQVKVCGVNPATDYPKTVPDQLPDSPMAKLDQYKNVDGFSHVWTRYWYSYEPSPTCSKLIPACGSPYLECDVNRGRCVSIVRKGLRAGVADILDDESFFFG